MTITRNKPTAIEMIRRFYLDDRDRVELTDKQEEIRQRLVAIHTQLCAFKSPREAVKKHKKRFQLSDVQAWRDLRDATALFGDVNKAEKEGIRYIVYEYACEVFRMARKKKDFPGMAKAVSQMIKVMGLDKEDPDLPDFEKIKASMIFLALPAGQEERLDQLLASGVVNFSKMNPPNIEDIEYESIEEEE